MYSLRERKLSKSSAHENLQADIVAGLTVGVMAVPQVVSFAAMAGLPAQFGLYGCFAPVIAYAFFGGSPHLVCYFPA